jgi:hypothetical protein
MILMKVLIRGPCTNLWNHHKDQHRKLSTIPQDILLVTKEFSFFPCERRQQ